MALGLVVDQSGNRFHLVELASQINQVDVEGDEFVMANQSHG